MKYAMIGLALALGLIAAPAAQAADYQVTVQPDVVYAEHDGTKLLGDFYLPKGLAKAPALIAIHGGGWQVGSRAVLQILGAVPRPATAMRCSPIEYRLGKAGTYPGCGLRCEGGDPVRARQGGRIRSSIPDRIGLIGDSAGAHLVGAAGARWRPVHVRLRRRCQCRDARQRRRRWSAFTASTTCWRSGPTT